MLLVYLQPLHSPYESLYVLQFSADENLNRLITGFQEVETVRNGEVVPLKADDNWRPAVLSST